MLTRITTEIKCGKYEIVCTHLLNLFGGFSGAVFLQVGYSFLLGGMCAFTLLCTKNIFCAAAVHAVFNFCGQFVERFGRGAWNTPGIITFTACLGVCVAAYVIYKFLRFKKEDTEYFYALREHSETEDTKNKQVKGNNAE